ncbi:MAG: RnfABCDGE type electron transport complex subunit D, partial [Luminiphilus sp.]|nr:RnfABCDGE type electron transport complex subunit D [Luminiphilus sp.]
MSLLRVTSPHASGLGKVSAVMRDVLLATVPGVLVMTWFFGPGTLINLVLGAAVALALEYGVMALR